MNGSGREENEGRSMKDTGADEDFLRMEGTGGQGSPAVNANGQPNQRKSTIAGRNEARAGDG